MLKRIEEVSKALVVLGAILYLFGFITINSFLARFGIVSFDIVNSRFVFAGFFSFISTGFVIFIAWKLYQETPLSSIFDLKNTNIGIRISKYMNIGFTILISEGILLTLLKLGKSYSATPGSVIIYARLFGAHDLFGSMIEKLKPDGFGIYWFLVKGSLNIFLYVFLIYAGVFLINRALKFISKSGEKVVKVPSEIKVPQVNSESPPPTPQISKPSSVQPSHFFWTCVDLTIIGCFLILGLYCYTRIMVDLVDVRAFQSGFDLTDGLVFSWFYLYVMTVYLFLNTNFSSMVKKPISEIFETKNINSLSFGLQQSVVPIVGGLVLFGQAIFPRIPFMIGGGEPRLVKIVSKEALPFKEGKVYVIGESSEFIFLSVEDSGNLTAFQINKSEISYIQTR